VSVRAKLFLLLVALSALPILLLRMNALKSRQELTNDLVHRSQHLLVAKAKNTMRLMVEDHAELWKREGLLLEQTLRLQAMGVEKAVAKNDPLNLSEIYRSSGGNPELRIFGQITAYENGNVVVSDENARLPKRFEARESVWYQQAMLEKGMVWTAPVIDPSSRRVGLTLSIPVKNASGKLVGVTALTAPLSVGGPAREHSLDVSSRSKVYLVNFTHPEAPELGLRIIGQAGPEEDSTAHKTGPGSGSRMGMMGLSTPRWISPDEPEERVLILSDLTNGMSEVRQAELEGSDYIWAYAPAGVKGLALVLIAPKRDVTADAALAGEYIESRMQEQLRTTFFMFIGTLTAIALTAWLVSRTVTKPITDLSLAAAKLGEGDFDSRVQPAGGRELKELGRVFNEMGPQLKDHTRLTAAMALAQEVHHRLLPADWPELPGLDLAAISLSCEEVGGDSFDVIPGAHGQSQLTAVLVGDVSGHGLDAALLMATARAFLRMRAHQPGSPAEVVTAVNRYLTMDTTGSGRFMTLFYLEIDPAAGCMRWVRAGHDPAILYNQTLDEFEEIGGPGIPLGVIEDRVFPDASRPCLLPGEVLLIGSDGLWEARGSEGGMFGKERVRSILRQNAIAPSKDILGAIMAALRDFKEGSPLEDDVTLMVIKSATQEVS